MRTSAVVTISLHPQMLKNLAQVVKNKNMTRSEFIRAAIREQLEYVEANEAMRVYREEKKAGTLKKLPIGGLAKLIKQR